MRTVLQLRLLALLIPLILPLTANAAQAWKKIAPASSTTSSDIPTYLGVTTSSYDGAGVGGYTGANAKCVAQYGAGARMMQSNDTIKIVRTSPYTDGWIDVRDSFVIGIGGASVTGYGSWGAGGELSSYDCGNYSSSSSSSYGFFLNQYGGVYYDYCNTTRKIHCVK